MRIVVARCIIPWVYTITSLVVICWDRDWSWTSDSQTPKSYISAWLLLYTRVFCVYKKGENIVLKNTPTIRVAGIWKKANCKSFREVRFITSPASPILYTPRKNQGPFPASPAQHTDSIYVVPGPPAPTTYLARHSRQAKLALTPTRRHTTTDHRRERGGSERELAYGADAGRWAV